MKNFADDYVGEMSLIEELDENSPVAGGFGLVILAPHAIRAARAAARRLRDIEVNCSNSCR